VFLQQFLAYANALWCHFYQLIILDKFQGLLQGLAHTWRHYQVFVGAGGANIGELLGLGGVDAQIIVAAVNTDDLPLVDIDIGVDHQPASVLQGKQGVRHRCYDRPSRHFLPARSGQRYV